MTAGSITVDLKIKGVGSSRIGLWILGVVARVFNINLEVVSDDGDIISTTRRSLDELKRRTEQLLREIDRLRSSRFVLKSPEETIIKPCEKQQEREWNDRTDRVKAVISESRGKDE
jgi:hypothetical protein